MKTILKIICLNYCDIPGTSFKVIEIMPNGNRKYYESPFEGKWKDPYDAYTSLLTDLDKEHAVIFKIDDDVRNSDNNVLADKFADGLKKRIEDAKYYRDARHLPPWTVMRNEVPIIPTKMRTS